MAGTAQTPSPRPIQPPDGVPANLRGLVKDRVDPLLADVRLLLSYPRVEGDAEFNLTAVPEGTV